MTVFSWCSYKGQIGLFPAAFLHKHESESYFLQLKVREVPLPIHHWFIACIFHFAEAEVRS